MEDLINKVPTMAEMSAKGESPEVLFWVGCAGSFDERYKAVTVAFAKLLNKLEIKFAILGNEEGCTGDPARRAGNEFVFQSRALANIQLLNQYGIKNIVTACPHCFNTLKNEYPELGGTYKVSHHTDFLQSLLNEGKLKIAGGAFKGKKIVYHDSCFLGRANDIYEAPRKLIEQLDANLTEMKRAKKNGLCCGAGGAQMFKEPENGAKDINIERTEEALETGAEIIATACPFCLTMLTDGLKGKNKEDSVRVLDIAELLAEAEKI